jgi:hypothetical protein
MLSEFSICDYENVDHTASMSLESSDKKGKMPKILKAAMLATGMAFAQPADVRAFDPATLDQKEFTTSQESLVLSISNVCLALMAKSPDFAEHCRPLINDFLIYKELDSKKWRLRDREKKTHDAAAERIVWELGELKSHVTEEKTSFDVKEYEKIETSLNQLIGRFRMFPFNIKMTASLSPLTDEMSRDPLIRKGDPTNPGEPADRIIRTEDMLQDILAGACLSLMAKDAIFDSYCLSLVEEMNVFRKLERKGKAGRTPADEREYQASLAQISEDLDEVLNMFLDNSQLFTPQEQERTQALIQGVRPTLKMLRE